MTDPEVVTGGYPRGETVTRERGTLADDGYGGTTVDWATPVLLVVTGCAFAPLTIEEKLAGGRDAAEDAWTLYAPWADISHLDRIVRATGERFEVDGHPNRWQSPHTGRRPGMTVRMRRLTGLPAGPAPTDDEEEG